MKLKDKAEMLVPKICQMAITELLEINVAIPYDATAWPLKATHQVQERTLPCPGGADNGHHLRRRNLHTDTTQHVNLRPVLHKVFIDMVHLDQHRLSEYPPVSQNHLVLLNHTMNYS